MENFTEYKSFDYWIKTEIHAEENKGNQALTQVLFDYINKHQGEDISFEGEVYGDDVTLIIASADEDVIVPDDLTSILDWYHLNYDMELCDELNKKEYTVTVTLTISKEITVEASSEEKAEELADEMLDRCDGDLSDYISDWYQEDCNINASEN